MIPLVALAGLLCTFGKELWDLKSFLPRSLTAPLLRLLRPTGALQRERSWGPLLYESVWEPSFPL